MTRDYLDLKLGEMEARLRAAMSQSLFVQGLAIIGLTVGLVKLLK